MMLSFANSLYSCAEFVLSLAWAAAGAVWPREAARPAPVPPVRATSTESMAEIVASARSRRSCQLIHCRDPTAPSARRGQDTQDTQDTLLFSTELINTVTHYDPDKPALTVGAGVRLGTLLLGLRNMGMMLEHYGVLPDLTLADAINIGFLERPLNWCEVVDYDGQVNRWERNDSGAGAGRRQVPAPPPVRALVGSLGTLGVVTACSVTCTPLKLVRESCSVLSLKDMLHDRRFLQDSLYVDVQWVPVLGEFVVTSARCAEPGGVIEARGQPMWKWCWEVALRGALRFLSGLAPLAARLSTPAARRLAGAQHALLREVAASRTGHSFWPQRVEAAEMRGAHYSVEDAALTGVLRVLGAWGRGMSCLAAVPVRLTLHHPPSPSPGPWSLCVGYSLPRYWWRKTVLLSELDNVICTAGGVRYWPPKNLSY